MTDARKIEILRSALKVIYTWASYDAMPNPSPLKGQCLAPEHVEKLCRVALQKTETKKEKL